jgi:drug/metabolite transporter (DMT)-like permease
MGRSDGAGSAAILAAAVGYGLSTTLSVAVLRQIAPTDLLAVELGGGATLLVVTAAALGRLTRAGSARNLLLGILAPGLAFVLGDFCLGLQRSGADEIARLKPSVGPELATSLECDLSGIGALHDFHMIPIDSARAHT